MKLEYYGEFLRKIDANGGIAIPSRLRKKFKRGVIIVPSSDGCLTVHPGNKKKSIPINKQGRVLIPQFLRKQAQLQREIVIVGCGDYIEIWDEKKWKDEEEEAREIQKKGGD